MVNLENIEICKNPFRKRRCANPDIELYIRVENETLPICIGCWKKIAEGDQEWGSVDKSTLVEQNKEKV